MLRAPAMVLAVAITVGRAGRTGFARGLSGFADLLAEAANVTNVAAGVMAGAGAVRVDVKPAETTTRITVEVPDPADAGLPAGAPSLTCSDDSSEVVLSLKPPQVPGAAIGDGLGWISFEQVTHLSGPTNSDGGAVDRATRQWAVAQDTRQSDTASSAHDGLYDP